MVKFAFLTPVRNNLKRPRNYLMLDMVGWLNSQILISEHTHAQTFFHAYQRIPKSKVYGSNGKGGNRRNHINFRTATKQIKEGTPWVAAISANMDVASKEPIVNPFEGLPSNFKNSFSRSYTTEMGHPGVKQEVDLARSDCNGHTRNRRSQISL